MKIINFFCIILITSLFTSCGSGNQKPSALFEISLEKNVNQVNQNQEIGVSIKNKKEKQIESIQYSIDGTIIPIKNDKIIINVPTLGNKILSANRFR